MPAPSRIDTAAPQSRGTTSLHPALLLVPLFLALISLAAPVTAADPDLLVEVITLHEVPLTFDSTLAGSIQARHSVNIGFRHGGKVTEVLVNEGDHVRRGQALARTDATQQQQALNVARATAESAQATHQQTRMAFERAEAMLARGVGTRAELDAATQALSAAEGTLALSQTTLAQARRAMDDTTLLAPDDAIITARNVNPGQIAAAAQPMLSLAETDGLEAVFDTPDMPLLKNALGVPISIKGLDPTTPDMSAIIREVSPLVDPQTGAVAIRAQITDAPQNAVLLGAAVRGTVHFPAGNGIKIPKSALTATADGPAVWRVDPDLRVWLTPVTIERFTTDSIVLSDGVHPGDLVVGAGAQLLYPGRRIAIPPRPPQEDG